MVCDTGFGLGSQEIGGRPGEELRRRRLAAGRRIGHVDDRLRAGKNGGKTLAGPCDSFPPERTDGLPGIHLDPENCQRATALTSSRCARYWGRWRLRPRLANGKVCTRVERGSGESLRGRASECETLRGLISTVQSGSCQVLVLRGEAGVGKTALLDYVSELATGFRSVHVAGVESDMELAFAGLQQLCAPLMDHARRVAGAAARSAGRGLRPRRRADPGPVPGRVGRAEPDGRRRQRPTAAVRHRRRAVARPGVGADTRPSSRGA